jgi:hypothetical protein
LICNSTISPTTASELLKTAVTLGESASTRSFPANAISAASQAVISRERDIDMFNQTLNLKHQTSRHQSL